MSIRTWRAAKILGMSEGALGRHQKAHGDRTIRPWWRDTGEGIAIASLLARRVSGDPI